MEWDRTVWERTTGFLSLLFFYFCFNLLARVRCDATIYDTLHYLFAIFLRFSTRKGSGGMALNGWMGCDGQADG